MCLAKYMLLLFTFSSLLEERQEREESNRRDRVVIVGDPSTVRIHGKREVFVQGTK